MLEINNLHARVDDKEILKGLNLAIRPGEVHAIMGPNGAGKSTLSNVIAGREGYDVTSGEILFENQDLLALEPETRACEGIFLGFQYPEAGNPGLRRHLSRLPVSGRDSGRQQHDPAEGGDERAPQESWPG